MINFLQELYALKKNINRNKFEEKFYSSIFNDDSYLKLLEDNRQKKEDDLHISELLKIANDTNSESENK